MNDGEMIGIQGYHLKFLGLASPSLIPLNKNLSRRTAASGATADCCPARAKAMQSGCVCFTPPAEHDCYGNQIPLRCLGAHGLYQLLRATLTGIEGGLWMWRLVSDT